jgi:hypothetical protein
MPPTGSKLGGKVLHSQSREIVSNVYKYMKEAGAKITVKNIGLEVAKVTGVSEINVRRIIRETKTGVSTSFSTPHK